MAEPLNVGQDIQSVLDAVDASVWVLDGGLRVAWANRPARDAFGDPQGRTCHEIFRAASEPCPDCPVRRAMVLGEPVRLVEPPAGAPLGPPTVHMYAKPLSDGGGAVTGAVLTAAGPGPRVQLQRELRDREVLYKALFEEVPCYISVQDRDFHIVQTNRRFRETFDFVPGRGEGCCYEVYKHREEPCLRCPMAATFSDGQSHASEEMVTSRDGRRLNTLVVTAPLRNEAGEIEHVIEMSTDITELRRLQSQLEALGMLVGQISHDIKGLLTGLDGGIYMVDTGMERHDSGRLTQGWGMVRRNVERIRSLVLNILYYAKDRVPEYRLVSPLKLAEETLAPIEARAAEHHIRIEREMDPSAVALEADARAVQAMLTNLLENALDACRTDCAKEDHCVRLRVAEDSDCLLFEIGDDGVGMDREMRDNAFSAFFSSKGSSGTGLGLYIAHRIAAQHGGSIALTSELGTGTTATVRLPKRPPGRRVSRRTPEDPAKSPAGLGG